MSWEEIEQFNYKRYRDNPSRIDQEPTLLATAKAFCIEGTDVIGRHIWPFPYWKPIDRYMPTTYGEIRWRGGIKAVRERIRRGGLGIEEMIRPWSGGFWKGLILSGALRVQSLKSWGRYQIWQASHTALIKDLEQAKIGIHFEGTTGASGCRRLTRCPSMFLPAEDEDVTAGLFAGARIEDSDKGRWMVLSATEETKSLLKRMTILFHSRKPFRGQELIAVAPFYAALFAHRMPTESSKRVLGIKSPALGEILPLMYWEAYFMREGQPIPPVAKILPFCISPRTYRRRKYRRRDFHKKAVLEFHILSLAPPLRQAMMLWQRSKSATSGEVITPQTDFHPITA